ncbi:MAG: hypothetical protein HUU46_17010 [Candidatus Hydrogenedentes bacterium]|nr:hypothetical protein [Candidatus Hydrogenedentota bacterium]
MERTAQRIRVRPRTFDIYDWTCVEMTPQSIVFRPGSATLIRRLGATLIAALLIVLMSAYVFSSRFTQRQQPQTFESDRRELQSAMDSLRESMTPGEWQRIQDDAARTRAEREARQSARTERYETIRSAGFAVYGVICGLLAMMGIYSPSSALWHRVSIFVSGRNQITVASRGLWTTTNRLSIDRDTRVCVRVVERLRRRRHARMSRLGYRWTVSIEPAPGLELLGATMEPLSFDIHHQTDRPVEEMPLPPRVRQFVEGIQRMTGLLPEPLVIMDYEASSSFFGGRGRLVSSRSTPVFSAKTYVSEPVVLSRTINVDEMSPEMRAQFESLRARARPDEVITAEITTTGGPITYRDQNGAVHTYQSLDEMPEDVRAIFAMMRRAADSPHDDR